MREIKFRFFDGRVMSYESDGWREGIGINEAIDSSQDEYGNKVMQFTGLLDMNGKEIYESDVVLFTYWWFDGNVAESTLTGTIIYSDVTMSFQLKGVKNKEWQHFTGHENDTEYLTPFSELDFEGADFKVIGNIYDNPELLEVEA